MRPAEPAKAARASAGARPLAEAHNAHRTNTKEEFEAGLKSGANWFEGDVRLELDGSGIEMRHDTTHESGDNLTLREWLQKGKAAGVGLKLDIKEPQHMPAILDELARAGIPEDRLMINVGFGGFEEWGRTIREPFPNAILALNPPTEGPIGAMEAARMVRQAQKLGGPVTFVVRHDRLTDEAISTFKGHGTISVWGHTEDVRARTAELKRRGVDGMIDLSPNHVPGPTELLEKGWNWARTKLGF